MILRAATARNSLTRRALVVSALMLAAAASTARLRPAPAPPPEAPDFEALLPDRFGEWRRLDVGAVVLPPESTLGPGESIAYRAYGDRAGRVVTFVAAYGPPLGDSVRLHRPESCYVAQGFAIVSRQIERIETGGVPAHVIRLQTKSPARSEAVSYWLRSGPDFVTGGLASHLAGFRRALSGPPDGALVRVSSAGEGARLFDLHSAFLSDFARALSPEARAILLGTARAPGQS